MEGFVSKLLTKAGIKVEVEVEAPITGDTLSITIKNIIVITWMSRIHERLIDCVRVEFASELRGEKELIELMPRIADNRTLTIFWPDTTSPVLSPRYPSMRTGMRPGRSTMSIGSVVPWVAGEARTEVAGIPAVDAATETEAVVNKANMEARLSDVVIVSISPGHSG